MKTLTVDQIMSLRPCAAYPESRVRELWGDRESLSLVEILRLDIPAEDRIWVLTRDGVCDRAVLRRWADAIADRAVRTHCLTCGVPAVESWARGWLDGTARTYAAADAADAAAYAASAAAYAAARAASAASAAAQSTTAYAAARAASAASAAALAAEAADAAERERRAQVDDLIRALNDAEVKARIKGLAAAGYCDRLAVRRLLADLRGQPGCERIQERSLNNYLAGRSRMPAAVEKGLDALIERGADQ